MCVLALPRYFPHRASPALLARPPIALLPARPAAFAPRPCPPCVGCPRLAHTIHVGEREEVGGVPPSW
jgi:hypothetical protein